jgi:hypothetical protein
MTAESANAVLLTAWLLVVVELVNGLPPTWAWVAAVAAFVAACFAVRRLPGYKTVPESARRRAIRYAAGGIGGIALVPLALAAFGAIGLAGGAIATAIVATAGEHHLWLTTRIPKPGLADAELVE